MKKLNILMILGLLSLVSCKEEKKQASPDAAETNRKELQQWQLRAEQELEKRQLAESRITVTSARADSMERAAIATGVAAIGFLILGGAMGSKAKRDVLES